MYEDSHWPIPERISDFHQAELATFAIPGTWLSAEERRAAVSHCRAVRATAGVQKDGRDSVDPEAVLPAAVLELIEALALTPQVFDRARFSDAMDAGIGDGEYVEIVGIVARLVNLDVFARGLGLPAATLPAANDGEASADRPKTARADGAWVDTIPLGEAGGNIGAQLYGGNMLPFIYRALSLSPQEAERIIAGGNAQYLTLDHFFDFSYSAYPALSRAQIELLAARVSAINDCFY